MLTGQSSQDALGVQVFFCLFVCCFYSMWGVSSNILVIYTANSEADLESLCVLWEELLWPPCTHTTFSNFLCFYEESREQKGQHYPAPWWESRQQKVISVWIWQKKKRKKERNKKKNTIISLFSSGRNSLSGAN